MSTYPNDTGPVVARRLQPGYVTCLLLAAAFCFGDASSSSPALAAGPAPSFDCAKAASKRERAVCANKALSDLDLKLSGAYSVAADQVPEKWKGRLLDDQRAWLAFADRICLPGNLADLGFSYADCLAGSYRDRIEELGGTLRDIAGYRVITLTRHSARKTTGENLRYKGLPHALERSVTIQQIVFPDNAGTKRWNAMIRREVRRATRQKGIGDEDVSATIDSSSPGFIQATLSYLDEGVGAGAGAQNSTSLPWLLSAARPLRASDLFAEPKAIDRILTRIAIPILKANFKQADDEYTLSSDQVEALVAPTQYWILKKDGIAIEPDNFNGVGPSNLTAFELSFVIPWADLRPYLRKTLPFDLDQLEDAP